MWMLFILLLAAPVVACEKGCVEYNGDCACEAKADIPSAPASQPSDEKPPQSGTEPWLGEGIHADAPTVATEPVTQPPSNDLGKTIPNSGVPER